MLDLDHNAALPPAPGGSPLDLLRRLQESGRPAILNINGQAELVVQDPASYQKLIELAERAEQFEALRTSIEEMRAGQGIPAAEVLAEMKRILAEKQGR